MVILNKIYTRTGDAGTTALGNGERVAKYNARVDAYGTSDELNCFVGVARLEATGETDNALSRIQNDLFDLGADLCRPDMEADKDADYPPLRMTSGQVDRLEREALSCPVASRWPLICMSAAQLRAALSGLPCCWPKTRRSIPQR